ncbi:MAG: 3-phosphoshikimate 1-carboxyvinyltransferase [Phycisphaerales bacterium]|nr:3-phosphoshikimate 1-carboxyvinyltransferase [Phycisphaerales bacterium]
MTESASGTPLLELEAIQSSFERVMHPPGSKSLTNRALILAALARGSSTLRDPLVSDDTVGLRDALSGLGAHSKVTPEGWLVHGVDGTFPDGGSVNLGDGGTPARFMLAAAAMAAASVEVDGSTRMRERPVEEGIELLRSVGVTIHGTGSPEHLPATVEPWVERIGGHLRVGRTASSQFLSALLLIAPWTRDGIDIEHVEPPTSETYIRLTLSTLRGAGAKIGPGVRVAPGPLNGFDLAIEPDASSAIYWWAAAAIVPGSAITVPIPSNSEQPDMHALEILEAFGAHVERAPHAVTVRGPDRLHGAHVDAERCPDAAVMLAVVAACARGATRIDGLHTLRVKETDRIHALATELARTECSVTQHDDAIEIDPSTIVPRSIQVGTWNDHRMAMAFGILGLVRPGVTIENPDCVSKSYPGFWRDRALLFDC